MIIDDEPFILDGLNGYNWEILGVDVAATCENGYEALSILENEPVDIILTDINMPIMDGLVLIEEVTRKYPYIYIVVLSGYGDFQYAQKCIKFKVSDYLLKPVNFDELDQTFDRLIIKMNQEKQQSVKQSVLERKVHSAVKVLRADFLKKLLNYFMEEKDIREGSAYGELIFESMLYTVCIFKPDRYDLLKSKPIHEHGIILFALEKIFEEFCTEKNLGYYWINYDTFEGYILITNEEIQRNELLLKEIILDLNKQLFIIRGLVMATISCGIGKPVCEARDIYLSVQQSKIALSNKLGEYEIIQYNDTMVEMEAVSDKKDSISAANDDILETDPQKEIKENNYIIKAAKEYIINNYSNALTLSKVAKFVYVSPEYLSYLFREITKVNFIDYLTEYRIEKAKELLTDPKYKVSEVSTKVGYENPRYFSNVFKKYTGSNPMEFRNNYLSK